MRIFNIFILSVLTSAWGFRCPGPEWLPRRNTTLCYFIHTPRPSGLDGSFLKTWSGAHLDCLGRGGLLTDLVDVDELDFIKSKMGKPPPHVYPPKYEFWLSLSYGNWTWEWADQGRPFVPGSLGSFDPAKDQVFSAALINERRYHRGIIWYDYKGAFGMTTASVMSSVRRYYICKAQYSNRPLCKTEQGWDYVNNRCWLMVPDLAPFEEAREDCFSKGGYIAVPSTEAEHVRLGNLALLHSSVLTTWIGLRFNKTAETDVNALQFDDGSFVVNRTYSSWLYYNVSNQIKAFANGHQYCGYLNMPQPTSVKGNWNINPSCADGKAYACESDLEKCPYGWDHFEDYCYQIRGSDADVRSWASASEDCTAQGGQLAIIATSEIQHFITARIKALGYTENNDNFYFGLHSQSKQGYFWVQSIGPRPCPTCSYSHWQYVVVPTPSGRRECAYLDGSNKYRWRTDFCDGAFGFVCQAHFTTALVMDVVHTPLKCDPPFTLYHDGCYFFSPANQTLNWDAANSYCGELNSTLVQIHTGGENIYVQANVPANSWIGIRRIDMGTTAIYQNSLFANLSSGAYTNFIARPVLTDAFCYAILKRDTLTMYPDKAGFWTPVKCTEERPFVCNHRGDPTTIASPDEPTVPESVECDAGWIFVHYTNSCIKLKFEPTSQPLAAQSCQNEGPDTSLLYIESWDEQYFIRDVLSGKVFQPAELGPTQSYWTALAITSTTQWYWAYRAKISTADMWTLPVGFVDFGQGQPNPQLQYTTTRPKCMHISNDYQARWSAAHCDELRASICKKPARINPNTTVTTPSRPPPPINVTMGCPSEWFQYQDFCYRQNSNLSTWSEAQLYCQSHGGNLVKLLSADQAFAVKGLLANGWTSLNAIARPGGSFTSIPGRQYLNSDGSYSRYTPWITQIAHPNAAQQDHNCVATMTTSIAAYACSERKTSTCMLPLMPLEQLTSDCILPPHDKGCQRWGTAWRDTCLYMGNEPNAPLGMRRYVTFQEAERFCQDQYGARLVSINSQSKQEFITTLLVGYASDYWIGLRGGTNAYMFWLTGEAVALSNWGHGEPSIALGPTSCVAVHGARTELNLPGDWFLSSCEVQKFALCEAPRDGYQVPSVGPTVFASGCPKGFSTVDGSPSCYKAFYAPPSSPGDDVVPAKLSWREAEDTCIGFRGHLASIETPEERAVVTAQFSSKDEGYAYWIGLYEEREEVWKWSDGRPYGLGTSISDGHGSPDLLDCVAMDAQSGDWIQQNCNLGWGWVCEVPKGFYHEGDEIPLISPPTTTNATCAGLFAGSGDWFYDPITDTCFMVSKVPERWDDAESACNRVNAHLATVELQQHNFLAIILSRYASVGTRFWIGLRLVDPMTMMHSWVDRSLSMYRAWDTNEPATGGVQSCVSMKNTNGKWIDDFCQIPLRYVCAVSKRPIVTPSLPPPAADSWGCPATCPGCVPFRGFCYYFAPNTENYSWRGASVRCNQRIPATGGYHSDLVSIHDQIEQDFLLAELGRLGDGANRWIGLQGDQETKKFYWSDETPFDWQSGWQWSEPNSMFLQPECGMIYGTGNIARAGRWNDEQCEVTMPYICKIQKTDSSVPLPPPPPSSCKAGYEALGSACFAVVALPNGPSSWREARNYCQTQGTRMATILNPVENAFVHVALAKKSNFAPAARTWIGMHSEWYENSGELSWVSGCVTSYNYLTNFLAGSSDTTEACVAMDFGGAWRTQHCDNERNQYVVCETRSPECTIKDVHEEGLCPVPFTENCLDYCYHVVPGGGTPTKPGVQISWRQAKIECEKLNSTLASVRSPADLVCIQDVIQFSGKPLWIGLEEVWSSEIGNYTWRWMNGDVLTSNWNNWSPGEPNYLTTIRDSCVEMYSNGKWNNVNCNDNGPRNGYVCEKRKIPYTRSSTVAVATSSIPLVTQPVSVASTNFPPPTHSPDPTTTSHSINGSRSAGGFKSGGHSGSYAGAAIAVIVLVAGLTCASYFVWHRRASGRGLTSRSTLKTSYKSGGTGVDNDITPVIGLEDDNHDVTYT